jgi:hypothetical protein
MTLKKKLKPTKCRDHSIIRLTAHMERTVSSVLRRRIEREVEDPFENINLELEEEKEPRMQT